MKNEIDAISLLKEKIEIKINQLDRLFNKINQNNDIFASRAFETCLKDISAMWDTIKSLEKG